MDSHTLREALRQHDYLREAQVVGGVGDLPLNVQRHLVREGLDLADVKGVFSAGRSYVVTSNLADVEEGIKTALHEVVGHAGVRALLGERFEPVMGQLYDSFPREHEVWQTTARRYGYLDTGTQAGRIAFAEELTAFMAETAPELSEFAMIKAEIRAQLREQFPALPMEEWEVHALIQRSRESLILRHGEPAEVEELKAKLSYRAKAVEVLQADQRANGRGGPDPLSLALYQKGSQVLDPDGLPTRLYHGAGRDVSQINGTFWGSADPILANQYAEMRADMGLQASVVAYYADIRRPFDGDPLAAVKTTYETPSGLTVSVFVEELIRQGGVDDAQAETLREQGRTLRGYGRLEESGPSYSPQDFWYQPYMMFGKDGAALLQGMFASAGFDGIRYTEQGSISYGAFSPAQLHFLDQGATLRGWQPDRGHGVGTESQAAFDRWFAQSHAVDVQGRPLRLYHGTAGDFSQFHTGRGAIYTTPDTEIASIYAIESELDHGEPVGPQVMPLYLSLQNPLVLDEAWAIENLDQDGEREWTILDEVLNQAEQQGYDGAILRGVVDFSGVAEGDDGQRQRQVRAYDQYIAFRPEQIKSALTNVGTFDPTNPDIRYAIHAYHGSPHKFTRFDLSKVNSGEGNQTFGHGLYFASMEAVASAYLYAGKGTRMQLDGRSLLSRENIQTAKADPLLNRAMGYLATARNAQLAVEMAVADERPEVAERVLEMMSAGRITSVAPGNLYEVVLSPNESDLLDWDAPIEEQSTTVLARLREAGVSLEPDRETLTGKFTGKDLYMALVMRADEETFDRHGPLWEVVKNDPNRLTFSMDAIASRYLNAIGVPGLRYYDGDSRVSGGGSHNYVIFDDKLVEITDVRYRLTAEADSATPGSDDVVTISAFQRWFGNSAVVDSDGKPLVVFHGTEKGGFTVFDTDGHGRTAGTGAFFTQTRLGASTYSDIQDDALIFDREELLAYPERYDVTFEVHGDEQDGWEYIAYTEDHDGAGSTRDEALAALADRLEEAEKPGVYPVYLSLQNPMIVDCHHSNWDEIVTHWDIVDEHGVVIDFIHDPSEIEPYLEANPHHTVEDGASRNSNELAREAREMGFDGLIMLNVSDEGPFGQGYAWDDVIYVAFKPEQVKSIYNVGSYDPANEDIRYSLSPRASSAATEIPAVPAKSTFDRWFGGSAVTDSQGQPLAVYHGSPDIRGIIQQGFQRSPTRGDVYFFSDNYQVADTYADDSRAWDFQNAEPYTAPFYLSLQNPYIVDGGGQKWRDTERHIAEARALGHDGIIIENSRDEYNHTGQGGKLSTVYAVFNPEQIGAAEPNQPLYSRIDRQPLGDLSALDRGAAGGPAAVLPPLPDIPTLTVFHGTEAEPFERFEKSSSNDGFFFTQAHRLAAGFAGHLGHLVEAKLNIQHPADLRDDPEAWESFQQGGGSLKRLAAQGFDGAVYLEPPGDYADGTELVFVAFNADQIEVINSYPANASSPGNTQDVSTAHQIVRPPLQAGRTVERGHRGLQHADEALKAWLSGSKVVDANGAPLQVYHGTLGDHDRFDSDFIGAGNGLSDWGDGFYFASVPDAANKYAEGPGGNVRAVYLNITNPASIEVMLSPEVQLALDDDMGFTTPQEVLSGMGYDGIAIEHKSGTEYIVFSNDQIRSVYDPEFFVMEPRHSMAQRVQRSVDTLAPRYSFAGESARTAPRLQLANAQQAIQAGVDPEVVRQETGWFQGVEGRWRFEIDDSEASVRYGESTSSNLDAYLDWSDEAEHREHGVLLSTVLDHPALFEAYPQLKSYRIQVLSPRALGNAVACFDREERAIKMVNPYSLPMQTPGVDPVLSVLLHELQHGVQEIEGFARGGNIEQIRREAGAQAQALPNRQVVEDAEFILAEWQQSGFDSIDDFVAYVPCANFEVWQDATINLAKNPDRLAERRQQLDAYDNAPSHYRRLAGEVEARNVQTRLKMTGAERQAVAVGLTEDVSGENIIVDAPTDAALEFNAKSQANQYQYCDALKGEVVNLTNSGVHLQEATASMLDILEDCGLSVGWSDGGCRILAEALVEWSGGSLQMGVTHNRFGTPSHAVAVLAPGELGAGSPGLILDGEGVCRLEELYDRLAILERSPNEQLAAVGEKAWEAATSLPIDESAVCHTIRALEMHLGAYTEWSNQLALECGQRATSRDTAPSIASTKPCSNSPLRG